MNESVADRFVHAIVGGVMATAVSSSMHLLRGSLATRPPALERLGDWFAGLDDAGQRLATRAVALGADMATFGCFAVLDGVRACGVDDLAVTMDGKTVTGGDDDLHDRYTDAVDGLESTWPVVELDFHRVLDPVAARATIPAYTDRDAARIALPPAEHRLVPRHVDPDVEGVVAGLMVATLTQLGESLIDGTLPKITTEAELAAWFVSLDGEGRSSVRQLLQLGGDNALFGFLAAVDNERDLGLGWLALTSGRTVLNPWGTLHDTFIALRDHGPDWSLSAPAGVRSVP